MDEQVLKDKRYESFDHERWSLAQAAAWIIWRSRERVTQLLSDLVASEGSVQVFDIFNEAARRESVHGGPIKGGELSLVEAQVELWEHLKQGRLVAIGVRVGEATRSRIPSLAWFDLDYFPCTDGRSNSIGSDHLTVYDEVTVPRATVLKLWPDIMEDKDRPKRGRKRRIGQDQIDEVVFELFVENGDLSDDDPNWHTQGQVESAARAELEKKFGKMIVPLESTLRTYIVESIKKRKLSKAGN